MTTPAAARTIPIVSPAQGVTEASIQRLVAVFYDRVRQDPELGPIFQEALSHRWDQHLQAMVDFWSSVALRSGRYSGKPLLAHAHLPLTAELFERWLQVFEATAEEVCGSDVAAFFVDRARRIAASLQIGLGIGPQALRL